MERARNGELFLNFGHTLDHLFLLIYPTVVLAMSPEFGLPYSEMLPLALGGFIAFGAGSLPAGWLGAATPFRRAARVGAGAAGLGVYARPHPERGFSGNVQR